MSEEIGFYLRTSYAKHIINSSELNIQFAILNSTIHEEDRGWMFTSKQQLVDAFKAKLDELLVDKNI